MSSKKQKADASERKKRSRANQSDGENARKRSADSSARSVARSSLSPERALEISHNDSANRTTARSSLSPARIEATRVKDTNSRSAARALQQPPVSRERYMAEFDPEVNGPLHEQKFVKDVSCLSA
jgi:hypothetical protein